MRAVIKGVDAAFEPVTYGSIVWGDDDGGITVFPRTGHEAIMQRIRRMSLLTPSGDRIAPEDPRWGLALPFGLSGSRLWAEPEDWPRYWDAAERTFGLRRPPTSTKAWDEAAHPREPEGAPDSTGGRFTEGGSSGGGLSPPAEARLDALASQWGRPANRPFDFAHLSESLQQEVKRLWVQAEARSVQEELNLLHGQSNAEPLLLSPPALFTANRRWGELTDVQRDAATRHEVEQAGETGALTLRFTEEVRPGRYVLTEPGTWREKEGEDPALASARAQAEQQDYERTGRLATYLVQERAVEILTAMAGPTGRTPDGTNVTYPGSPPAQAHQAVVDRIKFVSETIWSEWKSDSASATGLRFQVAVADLLGVKGPRVDTVRAGGSLSDAGKAHVQALYETTQYLLKKAGVDHLDVYRAVILPRETVNHALLTPGGEMSSGHRRLELTLEVNGAASATTDPGVANGWMGAGKGLMHGLDGERVVLRSRVPAKAIISLPLFGKNDYHENEVVVGGNDWSTAEVWLNRAPHFTEVPYQGRPPKLKKAAMPNDTPRLSLSLWDLQPGPGGEWLQPRGTKALATADLTAGGALAPVEHAAGTVQAVLPPSAAQVIREWVTATLDPVDVLEVEETPHITVRYGFDPAVTVEQVAEVLVGVAPFRVLVSGLGIFEGAEGGTRDVLVAWVADDSGSLKGLHEELGDLPNTSTHDAYIPHMTLAFLPLGAGETVLDSLTETPHLVIEVDHLEWRGANGTRAPLPLTGGLMPLTDAAGIGTKAWDESQHPREPGGAPDSTGGQFAASGGGADARPQYEVSTVKEAYALLSQHQRVILAKPSMVSTLLDKLAREVKKARAAGKDAPNIDLCDVTVKDTNIFCEDSLGVPRIKMPQLKGVPIPGSPADRLPKDKNGKVILDEPFHDYLEAQGLQITRGLVPAAFLKATQNELDGAKAAKFLRKYEQGWVQDRALFVSADNYIVDGHHHWAAKVAQDARAANDVDRPFRIQRIHAPILEILVHALKFSTDMGVPPAPVFAKKRVQVGPRRAGVIRAWDEDRVAPYQKEWDESKVSREPAGAPDSTGGQFAESGGGGLAPELEQAFDDRLAKAEGEEVSGGTKAQDWDSLGDTLQEKVEAAWKSNNYDSQMESEVESWQENLSQEEVPNAVAENRDWVRESWEAFVAEHGEEHPMAQLLDADSLMAALESDGVDKNSLHPDVGKLTWQDEGQLELGGIPPLSSADRWRSVMAAWKDDYRDAYTARTEVVREELSNADPPDYLSESVDESLDSYWGEMSDEQKWSEAESILDDDDLEEAGEGASFTVHTPKVWEPFAAASTVTNYDHTRAAGLYLAAERTADLIMQDPPKATGHDPAYSRESAVRDANTIAKDVWSAWKEKSGSGLGLSLQVAAAEHFGIPHTRWTPDAVAAAKERADNNLPGGFKALKSYVQALNETSQYILKKAGVKSVDVYRAIMLAGDDVERAEKATISAAPGSGNKGWERINVDIRPNGAASTTRDSGVANGWNGIGPVPKNATRVVLRTSAPPSAVLSLPVYGQNVHGEKEVVVLGNDWKHIDAWLRTAPDFESAPIVPWAKSLATPTGH